MRKPVLVLGQCLAWSSSGCLSCLLAPVAAAGAWTHDAARCGVHAGDVEALDSAANMDAGDDEAPVRSRRRGRGYC